MVSAIKGGYSPYLRATRSTDVIKCRTYNECKARIICFLKAKSDFRGVFDQFDASIFNDQESVFKLAFLLRRNKDALNMFVKKVLDETLSYQSLALDAEGGNANSLMNKANSSPTHKNSLKRIQFRLDLVASLLRNDPDLHFDSLDSYLTRVIEPNTLIEKGVPENQVRQSSYTLSGSNVSTNWLFGFC